MKIIIAAVVAVQGFNASHATQVSKMSMYPIDRTDWLHILTSYGFDTPPPYMRVRALSIINQQALAGAWTEIDQKIAETKVEELSSTSLMLIIRGTFQFRTRLPAWFDLRDRIADEFNERALETSRLLRGLY